MSSIKFLVLTLIVMLVSFGSKAQLPNKIIGLYLTAQDFLEHKISYQVNTNSVSKIKLNDGLSRKFFTIVQNGKRIKVDKESVFGFISIDSNKYRILGNSCFRILDISPKITLYKKVTQMPFEGRTNVTPYYFSENISSDFQPLTRKKIIQNFTLNEQRKQALLNKFQFNTDLAEYDMCSYKLLLLNYLN